MLARIHIDPGSAPALLRALGDAHCLAVQRDSATVDVAIPRTRDLAQARTELVFFLRAWAADYPGAAPRVDW